MQCTKLATYASLVVTLLAGCFAAQQNDPKRPKVAVLDIRGDGSADLDQTVREILGEDFTIVSGKQYRAAARELRAKRMKTGDVKTVAAHLGVQAVIYGKLVRRGKHKYVLSLRVRDGKSGKLITKLRVPLRKQRTMSGKNARKLERKLMAVMEDVAPPPPLPAVEEDDDDDEEVAVAEPDARKRDRRTAKAEPEQRTRRMAKAEPDREIDPSGVELEDDFVIVDKVRGGQVIDDERPPGWGK